MHGGLIERELFGDVNKQSYFEHAPGLDEYMPYKGAIELVRRSQIGKPEAPRKFFPRDLLESIRNDATLREKLPEATYYYYTALGTHLDRFHGVDAFVECIPEPTKEGLAIQVTFDVTTHEGKEGGYKANMIILVPREGLDPADEDYRTTVAECARRVREELLTKLDKGFRRRAGHTS